MKTADRAETHRSPHRFFGEREETGQWIAKSRSESPYESRVLGDYSYLSQSFISSMIRRMSEQTQDAHLHPMVLKSAMNAMLNRKRVS
jgi:hypothetical protein